MSGGFHNKFNRNPQWNTLDHCPPDRISRSLCSFATVTTSGQRVCVCEWDTTTFISNWFSLYLSVCLPPSALSLDVLLPGDHILIEYTPLSVSVCACVVEWMSDLTDGSLRGECKGVVEQLSQLYRAVPGPDCLRVRSGFQFTAAIPPDRLWAIVLPRIIIASVYNLLSIVSSVSGFCPLECVCWKSSPFEGCRVSQQVRRLPMNGT